MKAIVYTHYGSPDVLQVKEVAKPLPQDHQLLIEVYAASVNTLDLTMRGPFLARIVTGGLLKPKDPRLGVDLAGRVEAVGSAVKQFRPGDEVFGRGRGAFAEYVCAREDAVVLKPTTMTFEAAAAVPVAALTALQGLRDKGHIQPGQKVLIHGRLVGWGPLPCRLPNHSGLKSLLCAARGMWTWYARLVQTMSLITRKKIAPEMGSGMI